MSHLNLQKINSIGYLYHFGQLMSPHDQCRPPSCWATNLVSRLSRQKRCSSDPICWHDFFVVDTNFELLILTGWWSWCWEKIVERKIKLLKLKGKQCWRWDRFVELGIKLLVLIRIFNVEFCYNWAATPGGEWKRCKMPSQMIWMESEGEDRSGDCLFMLT